MASHAQVEAAQAVARKAVTAALEDHCLGLVVGHDGLNDRLKDGLVRGVVDAIAQGEVDGVVLAVANANVAQLASAGEVFAILVERDGHDAIGRVESLLDAVAVVDVDVDVEDALLETQELEDGEHNVCGERGELLAGFET